MAVPSLISELDHASIVNNLVSSLLWSLPFWSWLLAKYAYPRLSRVFKAGIALKLTLSLVAVGAVLLATVDAADRWKVLVALSAIAVFAWTVLRSLLDAGVSDAFTTTEGGINYQSSLRLAKRSIDFLGIGAAKLTSLPDFEQAVTRCSSVGGEVRLLLSPPSNSLLETMAKRNGVPLATYQQNVRDSLRLLAHLKLVRALNINVRFYPADNPVDNQQFRLMFIDRKICLLSWTVWGSHIGRKNPQIVIKANEKSPSKSMYLAFETHFDEIWAEVPDVDLSQFQ